MKVFQAMQRTHRIRTWLPALVTCLALASACGSEDNVAKVGNKSVSKAEFEAYLAHKRIAPNDAKRLERALDEYVDRDALAQAIEEKKLLDDAQIKAELAELKKEMLISRYFEKLLN
jgi:peptidyl-prolyl cis-trans isomerase C